MNMEESSEEEPQNLTEDEEEVSEEEEESDEEEEEEVSEEEEEEEESDEEEDEEPIQEIIETLGKDQLIALLKESVSKFVDIIGSVQRLADLDPAHRKIFVHGLDWDSNRETLIRVFSKYGEIEDCKLVYNMVGKLKGFGFILFKHRSGARKALKHPRKKICNRLTSCHLASAGSVPAPPPPPVDPPVSEYTQRKIFVSNVSANIDPQKLTEFFSRYGEIEEGPLGLDKHTGKFKGFCLFVYKSMESSRKALEQPYKSFGGKTLNCQKAIDGPKPKFPYQQYHNQHLSSKYTSGNLIAPFGPALGFNPAVAAPALGPSNRQALTALLTSQGAGLGATMNQGMPPMTNNPGYGNQVGASYGGSQPAYINQGGYQDPQLGQGSTWPDSGGASNMDYEQ
ncbi:UBP1-associated protein 2A-like [Impatiens glandulifera]|uniref:UBP1-associated protein 2A-like n=1 Tax=Impatiens glandulifera TaxID=253017 RepID=UPI001FB0BBEE|nr:UBP1-associated protein 2A-like [Impatiens glandulifera]